MIHLGQRGKYAAHPLPLFVPVAGIADERQCGSPSHWAQPKHSATGSPDQSTGIKTHDKTHLALGMGWEVDILAYGKELSKVQKVGKGK